METIWLVGASSTASELRQEPSEASFDVATQTRVPATMFDWAGPKTDAPQPPRSGAPGTGTAARVVKKT